MNHQFKTVHNQTTLASRLHLFFSAMAVISLFVFSIPATADTNLNCNAYAQAAVSQHQQNLQGQCGFKGGRWSLNYAGHFNWCRSPGVKISHISLEDSARKNALNACKNKTSLNCNGYAVVAVAQQKENLKLKCGFKGGRWTTNAKRHLNWCKSPGIKISHLSAESNVRKNALVACKKKVSTKGGSAPGAKYCKKAATATQAWRNAMEQSCKGLPEGKDWPQSWQQDFTTCMQRGGAWMDLQNAKRKKVTAACAKKKRTKTFTNRDKLRHNTGRYGWLSYDVCSNKGRGPRSEGLYNTCGKAWAKELCKSFGYTKLVKIGPTRPNDKRRAKWYNTKADGPSTWWAGSRKICHGKCYHFTSITCTK